MSGNGAFGKVGANEASPLLEIVMVLRTADRWVPAHSLQLFNDKARIRSTIRNVVVVVRSMAGI